MKCLVSLDMARVDLITFDQLSQGLARLSLIWLDLNMLVLII